MKNILRVVTLVFILSGFAIVQAQPGCPEVNTTANVNIPCGQTCANLTATAFSGATTTSYSVGAITYAPPFSFNSGTQILVAIDDRWSSVINLPFNFCFYGNTFSSAIVGSNGCISFNTANAGLLNNWSIPAGGAPFTGETDMRNSIMAPWQDLDPTHAGQIFYNVGGTAPCRFLEVSWYHCPMYGDPNSVSTAYCTTAYQQTQMAVIYETSNAIEVYIQAKGTPCTGWNNGWAIEGLMNGNGTAATVVPGRNATVWGPVTNDAYRFTPAGAPNYTIAWFNAAGTQIGTGSNITVCPPAGSTKYVAKATYTNCDNSTVVVSANVFVGLSNLSVTDSKTDITCYNDHNGSVTATLNSTTGLISYGWAPGGAGQTTLTNQGPGTYIFTATDSLGCVARDTEVLTNPSQIISSVANDTVPSCTGNTTNGTLLAIVSGGAPGYTFRWTGGSTANPITGLGVGTYGVRITDSHGCLDTAFGTVSVKAHAVSLGAGQITNASCFGGANGQIVAGNLTGGVNPVTYSWSSGSSTTNTLSGLAAGTYSVTATDANGCSTSAQYTVGQATAIVVTVPNDTVPSCNSLTNNGTLTASATGGTPAYTYSWTGGTTTNPVTGLSVGTYTVTVTDSHSCTATGSGSVSVSVHPITFGQAQITNASCFGGTNGQIIAPINGGSNPITYSWSAGSSTNDTLSGIGAGTYTVTATDANTCSASASFTVGQATAIVVTVANDTVPSCSPATTHGTLTATVSGGTPGYTYSWTGGATTNPIANLGVGNYVVTVTDSHNCTATASAAVSVSVHPITFNAPQITNVSCLGGSNGRIITSVTGGVNPITYNWSVGNGHTDTLANIPAGTYTVTAITADGCSATASYTVTQPLTGVSATVANDTVTSCSGNSNIGTLIAVVTGGTPAYTYSWTGGSTTNPINNLTAGTYTVTVHDVFGCSATASGSVVTHVSSLGITGVVSNPICFGLKGQIIVTVTGATPPVTYSWNPGNSTTDTLSGVGGGTYNVTATDANGCSISASFVVNQPTALIVTVPNDTIVTCSGVTTAGALTASTTGGTPTYTYSWGNNATTNHITGLGAGTYPVTVTDFVGCSATGSGSVIVVGNPVVFNAPQITEATCAGSSTGQIILSITGGTPPITFSWSGGTTQNDTLRNLSAGTYSITATDGTGCSATASYTITQGSPITFGQPTITNVGCTGGNNGGVCVTATGGTGTISYHWSNGNTTSCVTGLAAGGVTVTATDVNGCSASALFTVGQSAPIAIGTPTVTGVSCTGNDGTISVTATGGTGTLTYHWNPGNHNGSSITGLAAGGYTLTVTDANGCSATAYYIVGHTDCGCPEVIPGSNNVNIPCSQTCATLTASAFSAAQTTSYTAAAIAYNPPFAYNTGTPILVATDDLWSGIINLPFTFCFWGVAHTQILVGSNGEVSFNIGNAGAFDNWSIPGPLPNTTQADQRNVIMAPWQDLDPTYHGNIYYNITGTAPCRKFEVSWDNIPMFGDSGSVDNGYCSHTLHQTSEMVLYETTNAIDIYIQKKDIVCTNLSGGTYWNGGLAIEGITGPAANGLQNVTVPGRNGTQWTAANDAWRFTPSGAPNVTIAWFQGGNQIGTGTSINVCPLVPTTYVVNATYTDCANNQVIVGDSVYVTPGGSLTVRVDSTHNPLCNGDSNGSVYASYTDTAGTITSFGWSPGGANQTSLVGIPAGTYIFSVTTSTGCTKSDTVVLTNPAPVVVRVPNDTFNSCSVNNLGTLTATGSGGTPGYTYSWSNGATTATITGLTPGTYRVTTTDSHGCTGSAVATVVQISGNLTITSSQVKNATCTTGGSIIIATSGGVAPITYSWSPTEPNNDTITGLLAGTYTVTATDAGGCSVTASFTVTSPAPVVIGAPVIKNVTCNGSANGSIIVRASGGTPPLGYTWSPTEPHNDTITGLTPGSYCVTVTDSAGCTASACYNITQPSPIANDSVVIDSVTCTAGGSVFVYDTGGIAPLTYSWSNGSTTDSITNVGAGSYSLTVTDAHGCSITSSYAVPTAAGAIVFGPPVIVNTSCNGDSTGSITVIATGGGGLITFSWSNGATTATILGLPAGTYTVTASDNISCTASASYTVIQPVAIAFGNAIIDSASCNGASDGSIIITATGGIIPITYVWSNSLTGDTITGLAAGVYCVVATDSLGCSASICYGVSQPAPVVVDSAVITPVSCTASGKVIIYPSGGTAPYTYSWTTGSAGDSTVVAQSGTVTVTITDAHGCTGTASYTLNAGVGAVKIDSAAITNVSCNGGNNGGIIVYASDSLGGPITYSWTSQSTSDTLTGLAIGSYTVTATDSSGCSVTASYNITQPNAVTFGTPVIVSPACNGNNNGSITVTATGGTGTITYSWTGGVIGATDTALVAGTYTVTATDSLGCSATASYTVTQPQAVTFGNSIVDSITCNGAGNGSITVVANGGTGSFTYAWSNQLTGATISGLSAGQYCVIATDSLGCSASTCFTLTDPPLLTIDSAHVTEATCVLGGTVVVYASGGTGVLTYTWSSSSSVIDSAGALAGGPITVTVTDARGCTATATYIVPSAPNTVVIDSSTIVNVTCNGGNTGSITVYASGGTGSLHYVWNPNVGTSSTVTGLAAGSYGVVVTDSLGCSASATYNVTQPNALVVTNANIHAASCVVGGTIVITVGGGTTPYTYSWSVSNSTTDSVGGLSGGQSITVTVTDSNSCSLTATYVIPNLPNSVVIDSANVTNISCNGLVDGHITVYASGGVGTLTYSWSPSGTTNTITGLGVGNYSITVTDSLGCTASAQYNISQPAVLTITNDVITAATCAKGGTIVLTVTGGTTPYTFSWSSGSSVVDSLTNIAGGVVNVTVTDHNGCSTTSTYTVPVIPNTVSIDSDHITNELCHGASTGSITVFASGGNGTLGYRWTPTEPNSSSITSLAAGSYTVTVTDSLGCTATATYAVTQPTALNIDSLVMTQVTCTNQGSLDVHVSGGTPGYTYSWTGGANTDSIGGLNAGTYNVTITDANSCSITGSGTVTTAPNSIVLAFDSLEPSCFGLSNGTLTAQASGGAGGFTYSWSGGQTTATISGLAIGTYCVTVKDANGCTKNACYTLSQPAVLALTSFTNIQATCNTLGSMLAVVQGGTGPYAYVWSNGSTTNPITGLIGGSIECVTVTDHNGCAVNACDTLAAAPAPLAIIDSTITNNLCYAGSAGSISITVTGGLGGYTYLWSPNGATAATITGLVAGTYHVTVNGTGGCQLTDSFTITQPGPYSATVQAAPRVCPGACDTANVTIVGGTPGYTYSWSNGQTTQLASFCGLTTTSTSASVIVTDNLGCSVSASRSISAAAQITDTAEVVPHPCAGGGNVTVVATGGAGGALTYNYTPGGTPTNSGAFGNLGSGPYTYTITDTLGCSVSGSFVVPPSSPADVDSIFADSTSCFGFSDGSITVIEDSLQNAPFTYSINGGAFGNSNVFDSLGVGTYQVIVHNSHGCADTLSATVGQPAQMTISFSPDTIQGIANYATPLNPTVVNAINPVYSWTPATGLSCTNCADPSATLTAPQLYFVTVSDSLNPRCAVTDSVLVLLKGPLVMPDAFTPNGDGKNDFFKPVSHTYVIIKELHIYNRWGQLIYNSSDPQGWDGKFDGKEQPSGTYLYYIVGEYEDPANPGNYITGKQEGAVTLLR